jgi:hypothetical protein
MESELLELLLFFLVIYFLVTLVFRYLRAQRDQENETDDSDVNEAETLQPASVRDRDADATSRQSNRGVGICPHCGTENDPYFQYCNSCVREL